MNNAYQAIRWPQHMVLMGVAGSGKSTVGEALAQAITAVYLDGDDLHPAENIAKMSRGEPLTDEDRWPWLAKVGQKLHDSTTVTIIGCSALKRIYRDKIREETGGPVTFIHLSGSRELIASRMGARTGHFMPTTLLDSQFAALEPPGADEDAVTVDIDQTLPSLTSDIIRRLRERMPQP
ncbi:gluconokinase [Rhizobium oryzicola]|uniref:Gluconokinase n=1 Tax=Rhizobium oryzicola TaxID=1232668 RepID=A0ABT8T3C8_9HYPH|nr:gluconokinase [Rhizobium oryzicola]MDO1585240.1 gluconokinase [Rhizobium oryzicola]